MNTPRLISYGWTGTSAHEHLLFFGCAVATPKGTFHFFTAIDRANLEVTEAWLIAVALKLPPGRLLRDLRRSMIECPPGKSLSIELSITKKHQ